MTKIKNFRITLRARDMARWLKRERKTEITPELELSIEQIIKDAKRWVEPAALYTTLTRQTAEKTTMISFPKKAIAVSVIAVSTGTALETQRLAALSDAVREPLLAALQHEALGQSLQFVVKLIGDQAKEEECDMSPVLSFQESSAEQLNLPDSTQGVELLASLSTLLGVQRIGIALDSTEIPPHVRVAWLFWTPIGKVASRRAEKVAA